MAFDILDWPESLSTIAARSFHLTARNLHSPSVLTGRVRTAGPIEQRWIAEIDFPPRSEGGYTKPDGTFVGGWREAEGLIASLRGSSGLVRFGDRAKREPLYNASVTETTETWDDAATWDDGTGWSSGPLPAAVAVSSSAVRGARSAVFGGFPVSTSGVLRPGDVFEVRPSGVPAAHGHFYIVTRRANTDSSGETRVEFEPGLRAGVAAGDMIVLEDARTVFRLADESQGVVHVGAERVGRLGVRLVEVLPS